MALVVLAAGLPGCVTGHLIDAGRRHERPTAITAAALDGDRVLVRFTAAVTGDIGTPHGTADGAAGIALATLRTRTSPAADTVPSTRATAREVMGAPAVPVLRDAGAAAACGGPALEVVHADGRDAALVWHDPGVAPWAPIPTAGLGRRRIEPWVWPLVPATLAADAVVTPVLIILSPAVLLAGD
jgi:hypothetical protein